MTQPDNSAAVGQYIVVLCTVPADGHAQSLANALVERRLAACVNILPAVQSVYRWQGAVETGEENLLLIKTRDELFEPLREAIVALHPYELPEVIAVPIVTGFEPYLHWIASSTGGNT